MLRELAVMAKLLDKGGIVVVSEYESLITAPTTLIVVKTNILKE